MRRQEELTNRKRHKPPLFNTTTNAIPEGNLFLELTPSNLRFHRVSLIASPKTATTTDHNCIGQIA
jgi:hypothetical protein